MNSRILSLYIIVDGYFVANFVGMAPSNSLLMKYP